MILLVLVLLIIATSFLVYRGAELYLVLIFFALSLVNMLLAVIVLYRRDINRAIPLISLIITISITAFIIFHLFVIIGGIKGLL
ncbi:MAG: hypothetical protein HPY66_3042 [Firmicutes bacterium]|nr:hypothetical protein [Bacillota bacterium]